MSAHLSDCHRKSTYSTDEFKYVCSECKQPCIGVLV